MTRRLVIGLGELSDPPPPGFLVCALRSSDDEDDSLYPAPAPTRDAVRVEGGDGAHVQTFLCTGIEVSDPKPRFRARPLAARVQLTDSRLTIACSSPPRGGFLGGPIALVLNLASRLRRRNGRMLVGHVRYGWIQAVYAQRKQGPFGPELVRIVIVRADRPVQLDLTLPGDLDAVTVAETLIRRAGLALDARLERRPGRLVGIARP